MASHGFPWLELLGAGSPGSRRWSSVTSLSKQDTRTWRITEATPSVNRFNSRTANVDEMLFHAHARNLIVMPIYQLSFCPVHLLL